jgi:5'-nucleotidase
LPGGLLALAVEGPPALCVISACLGGFGARPDAVVSGVNPGNNTGRVVLHSGTVSAALTALTFGVPGLAVSLALSRPMRWDVAAEAALAPLSLLTQLPQPQALSINLPELGERLPRGVRAAHLAEAGIVQAIVAEPEEGALELTVPAQEGLDPSSDTALVHDGYATVTLLAGLERVRGDDQHVAAALVASCFEREAATA